MSNTITDTQWGQVEALYPDGLPPYIMDVNKKLVRVRSTQYEGAPTKIVRISVRDIVQYYAQGWGMAGVRTLGNLTGDWRMIDNLAHEVLSIFKIVNPDGIKREASKQGMEWG